MNTLEKGPNFPRPDRQIDTEIAQASVTHNEGARLKSEEGAGTPSRKEALALLTEVYQLLNDYAPMWYPEQLNDKLVRTLYPELSVHSH